MDDADRFIRGTLSAAVGILTLLATSTYGCNAVDGVPSWERCSSLLGNPTIEWPGGVLGQLLPLSLGIGIGLLVWWLLGRVGRDRS